MVKVCKLISGEIKLVVPKDIRWKVVRYQHDDNGHPGPKRTLESISKKCWFTKIKQFVLKYVNSCTSCQYAKTPTGRNRGNLFPIEIIEKPFHTLHLDHLGSFCKSPNGNNYWLVIVDAFTKFTWTEAVKNTRTKSVIDCLELMIKFCA